MSGTAPAADAGLWLKLSELIAGRHETAGRLLDLANRHTRLLCASDPAPLWDLVREEEGLLLKMAALEQEVKGVYQDLAAALKLPQNAAPNDLLPHLPQSLRRDFLHLARVSGERLKELAAVNETNRILTMSALALNQKLIRWMAPGAGRTYQQDGGLEHRPEHFSLLNKTV